MGWIALHIVNVFIAVAFAVCYLLSGHIFTFFKHIKDVQCMTF